MTKTTKGFVLGILIGALLMMSTYSLAGPITQYLLDKADYPVYVNGTVYDSGELPMLKYKAFTYVPLRAVSELLGVQIDWDEKLHRVDITREQSPIGNTAFRNIIVTGSNGTYTVTGEARVYEATFQYEVEDGHYVFLQGFATASAGGPEWGTFTLNLSVPADDLPVNGTLMLVLYEESAEDGSRINELMLALESWT